MIPDREAVVYGDAPEERMRGGPGKNARCLKQRVLIEPLLGAKLVDRLTRLSFFCGGSVMRSVMQVAGLLILIAGAAAFSVSQTNAELQTYFKESIGLS